MKLIRLRHWLGGLFFAACLSSVHAGVLTPIDVTKQADVNGKTVAMPVVHFDSIPQPIISQPVSPLTGQRRDPAKAVETQTLQKDTVPFSNVPTKVVPESNFETQRASVNKETPVDQKHVATSAVETQRAEINNRVIRPLTPVGEQDLKDQFQSPP